MGPARELTEAEVTALRCGGFAVIDGFLDDALAHRLAADAREHRGQFRQHQWVFAGLKLPKPGVSELDMHDPSASSIIPGFFDFWSAQVPVVVAAVCAHVGCTPPAGDAVSVKVQYNDGRGGCFPIHHDNPGPPSKRVLTIVVYLNEAWEPGHGGEIVFVPFCGRRIAVAPAFNRAVIFRSQLLMHGVLPAWHERLCFTIWVDDPLSANLPEDCNLTRAHLRPGAHHDGTADGLAAFFRRTPLQRSIARAVYMEEMSRDLERCLQAADGFDGAKVAAIVRAHEGAAMAQRNNPELGEAIQLLLGAKRDGRSSGTDACEDYDELVGCAQPPPQV